MFILKKRKIQSTSHGQKMIDPTGCRSINGYISSLALVCFALVLQILSLLSIYIAHSGELILCARQSHFDLSCLSYVRKIIDHNTRIRLCEFDSEHLILSTSQNIQNIEVNFEDHETYLDCIYTNQNKKIHMRIYYDGQGIQELEYL